MSGPLLRISEVWRGRPPASLRREDYQVRDAWLEDAIDEHWIAAFHLAVQDGYPIVAEVRVFPNEDDDPDVEVREPGEWSGTENVEQARVPRGGLSSTTLQRVRFTALQSIPDLVAWAREQLPGQARAMQEIGLRSDVLGRVRPGPKGPTDLYLARLARDYVNLVHRGVRNPVEVLRHQRRYGLSADRMRDVVHMARSRGLLTAAPPGRAGGELTAFAQDLLDQQRRRKR